MLGVEILCAQLGVVQHLGADLGASREIGQLDDLGQREAPRRGAVQEPGDVRLPGAREVVVLLDRAHLRAGEALDRDAPARLLFQISDHLISQLRHGVLVADEIGELHLEFLLRQTAGAATTPDTVASTDALNWRLLICIISSVYVGLTADPRKRW